jgi:hypothetical protein
LAGSVGGRNEVGNVCPVGRTQVSGAKDQPGEPAVRQVRLDDVEHGSGVFAGENGDDHCGDHQQTVDASTRSPGR